jgi:hypothetical protein
MEILGGSDPPLAPPTQDEARQRQEAITIAKDRRHLALT